MMREREGRRRGTKSLTGDWGGRWEQQQTSGGSSIPSRQAEKQKRAGYQGEAVDGGEMGASEAGSGEGRALGARPCLRCYAPGKQDLGLWLPPRHLEPHIVISGHHVARMDLRETAVCYTSECPSIKKVSRPRVHISSFTDIGSSSISAIPRKSSRPASTRIPFQIDQDI